jgi:hypothetical protein
MNAATARPHRTVKNPVFADFFARDLHKRFAASDDHLLRRWEQISSNPQAFRS